jgi:hypothetical protein
MSAREISCAHCVHFTTNERDLEAALRGVNSLSSLYASVRADDGLCRLHSRYLNARSSCAKFTARIEEKSVA